MASTSGPRQELAGRNPRRVALRQHRSDVVWGSKNSKTTPCTVGVACHLASDTLLLCILRNYELQPLIVVTDNERSRGLAVGTIQPRDQVMGAGRSRLKKKPQRLRRTGSEVWASRLALCREPAPNNNRATLARVTRLQLADMKRAPTSTPREKPRQRVLGASG